MISFRSGSCLSKLERVKENIFEVFQIRNKITRRHDILKSHDPVLFYALLFASFIRLWRDLADRNEIIRWLKRNVILIIAIKSVYFGAIKKKSKAIADPAFHVGLNFNISY